MGTNQNATSSRQLFAANLVRLRKAAGLSQEKFAEKAGLHRTYISTVESCQRNVSLDNIEKIAQALNGEAADLLKECPADAGDKL